TAEPGGTYRRNPLGSDSARTKSSSGRSKPQSENWAPSRSPAVKGRLSWAKLRTSRRRSPQYSSRYSRGAPLASGGIPGASMCLVRPVGWGAGRPVLPRPADRQRGRGARRLRERASGDDPVPAGGKQRAGEGGKSPPAILTDSRRRGS